MPKLPEWLLNELPEPQEPATIEFKNDKYVAISPAQEEIDFKTVDEAYDHAQKEWKLEVVFDTSLPEHTGEFNNSMIWGKKTKNGVRGLFSSSDEGNFKDLEEDYEEFLKLAEEYNNNPNDFKTVYRFVDTHPAFWNRPNINLPWYWMTEGHCALHNGKLTIEPLFKEDGSYAWVIETGAHVEPEYTDRYHDYKLDSYGSTVEEAYIKLAENIAKFYNVDGTAKKDVPHVKPQWILDVEKSMAKYSENKEEEILSDK